MMFHDPQRPGTIGRVNSELFFSPQAGPVSTCIITVKFRLPNQPYLLLYLVVLHESTSNLSTDYWCVRPLA